jgi:hypothetical protein
MFPMLDVAVGLSFTYLLLSLLCTAFTELVSTWGRARANMLVRAIDRILRPDGKGDPNAVKKILEHRTVQSLAPLPDRPPSYIPRALFVRAAVDSGLDPQRSADDWGTQFDATMERATGWYKRRMQKVSMLIAIVITLFANADTLRMADRLWRSPMLRAQFVEAARQRVDTENVRRVAANYPNPDEPVPAEGADIPSSAEDTGSEMASVSDPERELLEGVMGWRADFPAFNAVVCKAYQTERDRVCGAAGQEAACEALLAKIAADNRCRLEGASLVPTGEWPGWRLLWSWLTLQVLLHRLAGWVLTIAAITIGAPFWFDTLNRFINIRGTGKPPDEQAKR